jgi:hypothetical protein
MRQIITNAYTFEELSENAKKKAIENNIHINTEDDFWHELLIDGFIEDLDKIGFENAKIYFSGFWSQGDGLCFDADINIYNFCETTNEKRVSNFANIFIEKNQYSNHYNHEKTRYTNYELTNGRNINNVIDILKNKIEALRLEKCREFYNILEKEYYFLQSDETIIETILSNEYEFNENGQLI